MIYLLRSFAGSFVSFCIIYALMGVAGAFLIYVPIPMLINQWFEKRKGFALGVSILATAFSTYTGSAIYDIFGTYTVEFIIFAIVQVICIILMFIILKDKDK